MTKKHDKHHDHCEHEMAHCGKCDLAYCSKCSKEWGAECTLAHYPWTWQWGDTNIGWPNRYPISSGGTASDVGVSVTSLHASHS